MNIYLRGLYLGIVLTFGLLGCESKNISQPNYQKTNSVSVYEENEGVALTVNEDTNQNVSGGLNKSRNINTSNKLDKEEAKPQFNNSVSASSNKRLCWSIVRKKDHLPPAISSEQFELVKKYNAIYMGDTNLKTIYLTFDEGYENGYTPKILDVLKANDVKAAFFITMPYLLKESSLVDRMIKEGHIVGNHTNHHPSMPDITDDKKLEDEMLSLDMAFKEKTGVDMKYLRPPKGEYSERTLSISKDLGYRNVFWSFAYADWDTKNQKGTEYTYKIVMDNIHNGAVLLLHAVSKDNTEALDRIIKDIKQQGYRFGTLDEIK